MKTLLICLEVFFGRLLDVSIGSVRTIYLVKGKNFIALLLSFIEILIWFFVSREILINKELNMFIVLSYALGYSVGTYIGGIINKYLVSGNFTCMVITSNAKKDIVNELKKNGYGVSIISLEENKIMLLVEFKKKYLKRLKTLITKKDRNAFIIINESILVHNGYMN